MGVGVHTLDADHKTLIGLINDLQRSIGDEEEHATVGSVLRALDEYVAHHFAREERVLEACRYPGLATHRGMHRRLTDQFAALKGEYEAAPDSLRARRFLDFLHKWLIEHICSADMDYRPWVVGHDGRGEEAETLAGRGGANALDWKALRVLVVDDNQNFCQVLRTILEGVGIIEIRVVGEIATAKAALQGKAVDVLVADWHVGHESGLELVAWLRARPELAALPVLILSGHERIANRDVALNAGADEFMEKPISARGLLLCLARLMRKGENA